MPCLGLTLQLVRASSAAEAYAVRETGHQLPENDQVTKDAIFATLPATVTPQRQASSLQPRVLILLPVSPDQSVNPETSISPDSTLDALMELVETEGPPTPIHPIKEVERPLSVELKHLRHLQLRQSRQLSHLQLRQLSHLQLRQLSHLQLR
jgi:hypothetical protein